MSEGLARSLAALYARVPLGMRLGLEPMRDACARLDHPEAAFPTVHVAGTNGKGSVCAMVESIARAAGMRTGLYTSPHLCRFAERIRLDGEPIEDAALAGLLGRALRDAPELSFFETATLAAFLAFREARVDLGILEVGIGGRLDATNVIPVPRAAAITRIAFDHTDRLGPTLVDIAREKAGIAKPGLDIVIGPVEPAPLMTIEAVARANGATITNAGDDQETARFLATVDVGLSGAYQRDNAAVASILGARIGASRDARAQGIASTRWPGRLETLHTRFGPYLLDAAHNPDGAEALARHLEALGSSPARTALVMGTLADKAWPAMVDAVAPHAAHRFYVRPEGRTPTDPNKLAARASGDAHWSVAEAVQRARSAVGPEGLVIVTGSIFLVGEVRALLLHLPRDPAVAL